MDFIIYQSRRPSDTLAQAEKLRESSPILGIEPGDVRCPTATIIRRAGRNRERIEVEVPILGSFIFIRWNRSVYWAQYVEQHNPFITILRLAHGGYATCSGKEIDALQPLVMQVEAQEVAFTKPSPGDNVVVSDGLMKGLKGTVEVVQTNGLVKLKVTDKALWQLSSLLIHETLLTVSSAPIQGEPAERVSDTSAI